MTQPARKGRPRIEDAGNTIEARKPWLELKMSRRTWYARQAEKRRPAPYYSRDYCPECGKEWPECGHLTRGEQK
jgi:hypothetical protein